MIKAVIFDKDGVLVDSEHTHVTSVFRAFEDFGFVLEKNDENLIVGRHPDDYFPLLGKKYAINKNDLAKIRQDQSKIFYELLPETPVFQKTIDLLKVISSKTDILTALCTSGSSKNAQITISLFGMEGLFNVVTSKDDCLKRKPDPEPYITTAKKLGLKPEECLVIEDTKLGLESAKNAGMKCIVIYNDYTKDQDFTGAFKVVGSADKINLDEIIE